MQLSPLPKAALRYKTNPGLCRGSLLRNRIFYYGGGIVTVNLALALAQRACSSSGAVVGAEHAPRFSNKCRCRFWNDSCDTN